MACKNICKLCDHLVVSQAVTYTAAGLHVYLPAGSYANGEKYCIVIAQAIPANTVIDAPVNIRIGTGDTAYPLVGCDCTQVTACAVRTRTKYSTRVRTTASGGIFKLLGNVGCQPHNQLIAIDGA